MIFNDAITWDKSTETGGFDASVILSRLDFSGLNNYLGLVLINCLQIKNMFMATNLLLVATFAFYTRNLSPAQPKI